MSRGLSDAWLRELLRFAPSPNVRARAQERKIDRPWKQRLDRGYAEYAALMLDLSPAARGSKKARRAMIAALDDAPGRKVFHLTTKGIEALATTLTGSRKAASCRSASRPRSGRR